MDIKDVYRPDMATCPPTATLVEVARLIAEADSGIVAVVDDGRVAGVVSERDIVRALAAGTDPGTATAADHATTEVLTVVPEDDVAVVARRMLDEGVRRFPVVGPAGELMGMVSMRDLFALETLLGDGGTTGDAG